MQQIKAIDITQKDKYFYIKAQKKGALIIVLQINLQKFKFKNRRMEIETEEHQERLDSQWTGHPRSSGPQLMRPQQRRGLQG